MTNSLLPTGFRDRLPPEADASARLVRAILDTAASHGYERVQAPLAEYEASLTGSLGTSARDLLRFVDPVSGETMAVRSDITGQIGRIASTRMGHHPRPVRLSYGGPVVKLRATQLRPEREMMQVGAELIGLDSVAAAIEVVSVAIEGLKAAGVKDITLDLTMPDLLDVLKPKGDREELKAALDAKDAGAVPAALAPLIAAAGALPDALDRMRAFDGEGKLKDRLDAIEAIAAAVPADIRVTLDPTERHGFEYQTWFGFSLFSAHASGEIGRGGAYRIGKEPAIGFSAYIDPLIDAGLAQGERRRLFLPIGTMPQKAASLRAEGWVTVAQLTEEDSAEAQICTHVLRNGRPEPV
ncbi:ATP phosphoribosyltransferase regulatory subunit [uncultured Sphingorhabdus sp.]|uniref:ATP phosphoribosyltransferase regulatory subunit n=1 Tax=uncultured Sphingorhabdus sp. TaxID=1686106 RepID=UPI00262D13CF|nr:ATP phosphoribosyltransferase regulatory subunit [uncultured Sphingorhabdus sp.]HMS19280.1 ATP phosphoribosyltransferase regulatory subunit [Sphingorhabdus sp.]